MNESAGRLLNSAPDLATFLQYEKSTTPSHIRELFEDIDALTREFLFYSLDEVKKRHRLLQYFYGINNRDLFAFNPATIVSMLTQENQDRLRNHFNGDLQMQHGAAWLDSRQSIYVADLQPNQFRWTRLVYARLADDPNCLFYCAVARTALLVLLRFMDLRDGSPLLRTAEFELKPSNTPFKQYDSYRADSAWFERTPHLYSALGIDATSFFKEVESASHFSSLPIDKRDALIERFLDRLQESVTNQQVVGHLRGMQLRTALQVYYRLADKTRKPFPRKRFLNGSTQMVLSGYFEGSWLKFLEYIQEQPAENDYISTQVPKPQVLVPLKIDVQPSDLPVGEAERILDSLDPSGTGLRTRFALTREFWTQLIEIHAAQRPGMSSLWGLVEDYESSYHPDNLGLFRNRLPPELLEHIEQLFARQTSPQYPTGRASALPPYTVFCAQLNPALYFWHGVGLTIWFIAQGYARTDILGLRGYYGTSVKELAELGCPIDDMLFQNLAKIKAPGASFQVLNEIFVRFMRDWTEWYFERFWQERYKTKVAECGRRYNQLRETTGREPTMAQFVNREVATVVNEYFNGNVFSLLEVLGEPLPPKASIRDNHLIASNDILRSATIAFSKQELPELSENIRRLFVESVLKYCTLWEALGTRPAMSAFSSDFYYEWQLKALGFDPTKDPTKAWTEFSRLVERAAAPALLSDLGN